MVDHLTQHPYSDARNTVLAALALWLLAVSLAATSGALVRMGPLLVAAVLVFMSGIAAAATTMDHRIGAWIGSWSPVARVAVSVGARALAALLAIAVALAIAGVARLLARGGDIGIAWLALAWFPPIAGLSGAIALACARGSGQIVRTNRASMLGTLAEPRGSR